MKNLLLLFLLQSVFGFSQQFDKIEFEHGNPIIIGSYIKIKLQPIKQNKKEKVRVTFESKDNFYTKRISKEKYYEICTAISKIKNDTIAINNNLIDGSDTKIIALKNSKKTYYATGLCGEDEFDEKRKDFWYATKLILEAAKLKMKNLIDY